VIANFCRYLEKELIDPDTIRTILDVGARDCKQSIEFAVKYRNSKVIAFECNPQTLPLCRSNIKPYSKRIMLVDKAVNLFEGNCKFYPINPFRTVTTWIDGNPGASSLFLSNGRYPVEKYGSTAKTVE